MNIKAIETMYKGYRFRSRLEARWAVFLDSIGEPWDYEPQGFELPSGKYLPDFWLKNLKCWLEIKGDYPNSQEVRLAEELARSTDKPAVIVKGVPLVANPVILKNQHHHEWMKFQAVENNVSVYCSDVSDSSAGTMWWTDAFLAQSWDGSLCLCSNIEMHQNEFRSPSMNDVWHGMKHIGMCVPVGSNHVSAATSARFEHGESGVPQIITRRKRDATRWVSKSSLSSVCGIEICSRYDCESEINDMARFCMLAKAIGVDSSIERVFYDSKAGCCNIELRGKLPAFHPTARVVHSIALKTIYQFFWFDFPVQHQSSRFFADPDRNIGPVPESHPGSDPGDWAGLV